MKKIFLLIAVIPLLLSISAVNAETFYQGKTIKLVVATKPGGGYDFYGRIAAQYMQKYMPGSNIIVKNVPGAGHVIGANFVYSAKPNGLTFGIFNRALGLTQVAGLKGVKFNLAKMSWIGSASIEPLAFVVGAKSGIRNLDDVIKAEKIRISNAGIGTEGYVTPLLFAKMMGLNNFSFSFGYGGGEAELAMMRGEIDAEFASLGSYIEFIKQGHGIPIMFTAQKPVKGFEQVPLIQDVVKDPKFKPVIELLFTVSMLGRPFAGPPGIPANILTELRGAFEKAFHDDEVIKLGQRTGRSIDYVSGMDAEMLAKSILDLPPDVVALIKEAYGVK